MKININAPRGSQSNRLQSYRPRRRSSSTESKIIDQHSVTIKQRGGVQYSQEKIIRNRIVEKDSRVIWQNQSFDDNNNRGNQYRSNNARLVEAEDLDAPQISKRTPATYQNNWQEDPRTQQRNNNEGNMNRRCSNSSNTNNYQRPPGNNRNAHYDEVHKSDRSRSCSSSNADNNYQRNNNMSGRREQQQLQSNNNNARRDSTASDYVRVAKQDYRGRDSYESNNNYQCQAIRNHTKQQRTTFQPPIDSLRRNSQAEFINPNASSTSGNPGFDRTSTGSSRPISRGAMHQSEPDLPPNCFVRNIKHGHPYPERKDFQPSLTEKDVDCILVRRHVKLLRRQGWDRRSDTFFFSDIEYKTTTGEQVRYPNCLGQNNNNAQRMAYEQAADMREAIHLRLQIPVLPPNVASTTIILWMVYRRRSQVHVQWYLLLQDDRRTITRNGQLTMASTNGHTNRISNRKRPLLQFGRSTTHLRSSSTYGSRIRTKEVPSPIPRQWR